MFTDNELEIVERYAMSTLARLQNRYCMIESSNKYFDNFQDLTGQLGMTVNYSIPSKAMTSSGLVAEWQSMQQRKRPLVCNTTRNAALNFTCEELVFHFENGNEKFMNDFVDACSYSLGAEVEKDIGKLFESNTYKVYGDGEMSITSYDQLEFAISQFREMGSVDGKFEVYIPEFARPRIVSSALNQYVPNRNDRDAQSWEVLNTGENRVYTSNLLPYHISGTEGQAGTVLTVESVTTNTEGGVIAMVLTGASGASDPDAVNKFDKGVFQDGVSGLENVRFLTDVGYHRTSNKVSFNVTEKAGSDGANKVAVNIDPPLQAAAGLNRNISTPIVAGMKVKFINSYRVGAITTGKPIYFASPRLPNQKPNATSVVTDPNSGMSLRLTTGAILGQNQNGTILDCITGQDVAPDYVMLLAFPYN